MPVALSSPDDPSPIPRFALYGEPPGDVERAFLHVETIPQRSRLHDWTIRPHAHPGHHQVLLLGAGDVDVRLDAERRDLAAVALVTVPAATVHGFRFSPGADGHVLTISDAFLREAVAGETLLADLFAGAGVVLEGDLDPEIPHAFERLGQEFRWSAPGRRTAIRLQLQRILLAVARQRNRDDRPGGHRPSRDAAVVARYHALIEGEFRRQPSLAAVARTLGVTPARLNAACRTVAGRSALSLLHDRITLEAKRNLLYTAMSVAEVARSVGFADPAYFNRFFSRRTGSAPGAFRTAERREDAG